MFGVLRSIVAQNTGGLCKYEQQICIVSPAGAARIGDSSRRFPGALQWRPRGPLLRIGGQCVGARHFFGGSDRAYAVPMSAHFLS